MEVKDIMRTDFVSFQGADSLQEVLKTLAKNNISSAVVFDGKEFAGILSSKELVQHFKHRDFSSLWRKNAPNPVEKMRKTTAIDFAARQVVRLRPNHKVENVLDYIVKYGECIPVMEGKKVVGVVRGNDLIKFFLSVFAKDEHAKSSASVKSRASGDYEMVDTEIDAVLSEVKKKKIVLVKEVAASLGVPVKSVEKLAEILQRHHLVKLDDTFMKGATLRMIDHDK